MSIEAPRQIQINPGEQVVIISLEKSTPKGELSEQGRNGLIFLGTRFARQLFESEPGADTEFGNFPAESREAAIVAAKLREDRVSLPQVRDVLLSVAEWHAIPGISTRGQKRAWANRSAKTLKRFADQVLGEPDPENYK